MKEPQDRCRCDHRQSCRVRGADRQDHQREDCRITPSGAGRRSNRQPDEPTDGGPRQEHQRSSRQVRQDVGRELIHERSGDRTSTRQPEVRGCPANAETTDEQQRCDPQSMGDPIRNVQLFEQPVPRTRRPQICHSLVGHPAGELSVVPGVRRIRNQPTRIEIQIELRVARHLPRSRQQRWQVGDQCERPHAEPLARYVAPPIHGIAPKTP